MLESNFPTSCPSCGHALRVVRLACDHCQTVVEGSFDLQVLARLEPKDQKLVLRFLESSGSLKKIAHQYDVSYPTMRNRLDTLIDKVKQIQADAAQPKEG